MREITHPDHNDGQSSEASEATEDNSQVYSVQIVRSDRSWNGKPYERYPDGRPVLTVMRFSIPPHSSLPWHTHPMPNTAYVISGQFTVEEQATGRKRIVRAGEAFAESVEDIHRGYTDDEPVEIVCTYAGAEGLPLSERKS